MTFWQAQTSFSVFRFIKGKQLSWQISIAKHILSYFLQLDNAMIFMLYKKSWLKWVKSTGSVEFTLEALLKVLVVPKSLQSWLKTNKRLWKHCLVCYTKIPKNTGIIFSKIPVSVFSQIPVYRYFSVRYKPYIFIPGFFGNCSVFFGISLLVQLVINLEIFHNCLSFCMYASCSRNISS